MLPWNFTLRDSGNDTENTDIKVTCMIFDLSCSIYVVLRYFRVEQELPNVNGAVPGSLKAEAAESEMESLLVRPESVALLSSPPPQPKNPNGNNNYEMREYRRSRSQDNI